MVPHILVEFVTISEFKCPLLAIDAVTVTPSKATPEEVAENVTNREGKTTKLSLLVGMVVVIKNSDSFANQSKRK